MTGVDLDTELRRRAESTAQALLDDARAEAERIASEADARIAERQRRALASREAEYGAQARIAIAAERHAAMKAVLLARTRLFDRVLERTRAMLPRATTLQDYVAGVAEELASALGFVEGEGTVVRCSVPLAEAVREALRDRPDVAVEPIPDIGTGFVVAGSGDSVVIDCCLETRLERLAPALKIEIQAHLGEV